MLSDFLKDKLDAIDKSLKSGIFEEVKDAKLELKDLSTGSEWTSLKESICAFLNTSGGYVICGVRERNGHYNLTGFDRNNESKLIELRTKFFTSDNDVLLDLSDFIDFEYVDFKDKTIAIIFVRPVSEDIKFLKFNETYFERVLTADKVISKSRILEHRDYKLELEYSKELLPIKGADLSDLDVDKINQFIIRINATIRKETVKKDIDDARSFLIRRHCFKDNQVTTLGLLLFGKEPTVFLENRAEVDCFFGDDTDIGRNKQDFQDDVLSLMDNTFRFIWGHIKVGRSTREGGKSEPEYPEKLIREVINNALAHRDYTINKFITIRVRPNQHLEIKNPGVFKSKMLVYDKSSQVEVRRIIAGIPETKNPKLASILKAFDKIESQGIGMATLVSVCLDDTIDVPYYELETTANMISLIIPSGKLIDEEIKFWLNSFNKFMVDRLGYQLNLEHKKVLAYFYKSEKLNERRKYTILLSQSNNHFDVIQTLHKAKLIEEHSASREDAPIYILNRELLKTDFSDELDGVFSKLANTETSLIINDYHSLDKVQKSILNIIYRNSYYNNQAIKPTQITPEIYLAEYGKIIDPKIYETLGRRVRKICERFWKLGLLDKEDFSKGYSISVSNTAR
jgi:ATP-dependent DNA helicase RecG